MKPERVNMKRGLYTVYGEKKDNPKQLVALGQGFATNQSEIRELISKTYMSLSKKDRKQFNKNYRARKVNKLNPKFEVDLVDQATVLEVPVKDRVHVFEADICSLYLDGLSMKDVQKYFGISRYKVRQVLVDNNVEIRSHTQKSQSTTE